MKYKELTEKIIGCAYRVYNRMARPPRQKGLVASTSHRRPLSLIYYEACLNEDDAIKMERYFKSGFGRRFLRNRMGTYFRDIC